MPKKKRTVQKVLLIIIFIIIAIIASIFEFKKIKNSNTNSETTKLKEIVASASEGFTNGDIDVGVDTDHMYTFIPDEKTFCAGYGWALTLREVYEEGRDPVPDMGSGGRKEEVTYEPAEDEKQGLPIVQSVAYVYDILGTNSPKALETIQNVVWASWQWSEALDQKSCLYDINEKIKYASNSDDIIGRSYQFANFVYKALSNDNDKLNIQYEPPTADSLKVMVNQEDSSYTVGPYQISFPNMNAPTLFGNGVTLGTLVYNEITMKNTPAENEDNQFCSGSINVKVTFQNNTTETITLSNGDKNKKIQILGAGGELIEDNFPEFGKDFYIKYYTSIDAEIVDKIEPSIKIDYMKKYQATTDTYQSKHIKFRMMQDNVGILENSIKLLETWEILSKSDEQIDIKTGLLITLGIIKDLDGYWARMLRYKDLEKKQLARCIANQLITWDVSNPEVTGMRAEDGYVWRGDMFHDRPSVGNPKRSRSVSGYKCDACDYSSNDKLDMEKHELTQGNQGHNDHTFSEVYNYTISVDFKVGGETTTFTSSSSTSWDDAKTNVEADIEDYISKNGLYFGFTITDLVIDCDIKKIQPAIKIIPPDTPGIPGGKLKKNTGSESITLPEKEINMYIGGNVWHDAISTKLSEYRGVKQEDSLLMSGIQVELWDATFNRLDATTLTDKNGDYGFQKINPLHKYIIKFTYDGMRYESTKLVLDNNIFSLLDDDTSKRYRELYQQGRLSINNIEIELWDEQERNQLAKTRTDENGNYSFRNIDPAHIYKLKFTLNGIRYNTTQEMYLLNGYYTTAKEGTDNRAKFNDIYDQIDTSPQNYYKDGSWRKAYGLYTKLEDSSQNYIKYNNEGEQEPEVNKGSFRYYDALKIFENIATNSHDFDRTNESSMKASYLRKGADQTYIRLENTFKERLRQIGVSESERNNVWQYIMDTLITSTTVAYPIENIFTLEDVDYPPPTKIQSNIFNFMTEQQKNRYKGLSLRNITVRVAWDSKPSASWEEVKTDSNGNFSFNVKTNNDKGNYFTFLAYEISFKINGEEFKGTQNVDISETRSIGYEYLYTKLRDQSRNVNFGMKLRSNADLILSKDLYKTTLLVNTKEHIYTYNDKQLDSEGNWYINLDVGTYEYKANENDANGISQADNRAKNADYIGEQYGGRIYNQEIRKSEYLYDGSDAGTTDAKNLQVFVTYRIAIKNEAQDVWTKVDELVDYYDSDQYTFDETSTIVKENTFVGDANGNKMYDLTVKNNSIYQYKYGSESNYYRNSNNINGLNNYSSLYLTGIRSTRNSNMGNDKLGGAEVTYVYITFKVNNDASGKVKLDQELDDLINYQNGNTIRDKIGKKNIIEINGYSTYYRRLDENNNAIYSKAGLIDLDSNAGSLKPKDINQVGDIISSNDKSYENRLEDDTDKASNLKLKINQNESETRILSGYVFEDARTEVSDGAVIGNGRYDESDKDFEENKDKKINGVTVQLVELVSEVDREGFKTGRYETKEKVWSSITYNKNGNQWNGQEDASRYYSGINKSKVILSGPGALKVDAVELSENEGEYRFDSLPPGDFFIRFIYGDTTQTVLTNSNDEVQEFLKSLTEEQKQNFVSKANNSGILGISGLNNKSYTGQDYKSTIYQRGINQDAGSSYNEIIQYISTSNQNYNRNDANDKKSMYYYDIAKSGEISNVSDAKDVYSYRMDERTYSLGSNRSVLTPNVQTLKNYRSEVLASGTDLLTKANAEKENKEQEKAIETQREAIKELIDNTKMISQTGVINTEIEYNRSETNVFDGNTQKYIYHIQDIDLGLTERPRAQLNLSKELVNIQVRLANGQILFDATQSVPNLVYGKHKVYNQNEYYEAVTNPNGDTGYRLRQSLQEVVAARKEELVQATLDEELMSGATVRLTYKISVNNIGEVDYLDTDFYYLGKTINTNWENVSRTNARNIIDYVSNEINYESAYQDNIDDWKVVTTDLLLGTDEDKKNINIDGYKKEDNDYINSIYKENLDSYNVLVTTNKLSKDLIPRAIDTDTEAYSNSSREIILILSTLLENTTQEKNQIYTNLVELIESSNTWGRRMYFSKAGNQYVPYQSITDKSIDETTYWQAPTEPDSDSGQKVVVMVPLGENKIYSRIIVLGTIILTAIVASVILIKRKVLD